MQALAPALELQPEPQHLGRPADDLPRLSPEGRPAPAGSEAAGRRIDAASRARPGAPQPEARRGQPAERMRMPRRAGAHVRRLRVGAVGERARSVARPERSAWRARAGGVSAQRAGSLIRPRRAALGRDAGSTHHVHATRGRASRIRRGVARARAAAPMRPGASGRSRLPAGSP